MNNQSSKETARDANATKRGESLFSQGFSLMMRGNGEQDYRRAVDYFAQAEPLLKDERYTIVLLSHRGMCLTELKDKAIVDLKAALFAGEDTQNNEWRTKIMCVGAPFHAFQRQRCNRLRPHFSEQECLDLCQEVEIHMFSKNEFKCLACSKTCPSLLRCAGCNQVWFCDRACQKKYGRLFTRKLAAIRNESLFSRMSNVIRWKPV